MAIKNLCCRVLGLSSVLAATPCATALAGYAPQHGIGMRWAEGRDALVVGVLRVDSPADPAAKRPALYSVAIDSVVSGGLRAGEVVPLRIAGAMGPMGPVRRLPIGEQAVLLLGRGDPRPGESDRVWSIGGGGYDFMGSDGFPFLVMGPEAQETLRDAPRMIEIAGLGGAPGDRFAKQREAVWEEWRKGEMRPSLVLGWIIYLGRMDPAHEQEMLDFLEDLVDDRAAPPECRLMADLVLSSPLNSRPDYANNAAARAALMVELLARPDLPERERKQAERTLADLTRRLEAEKAPETTPQGVSTP